MDDEDGKLMIEWFELVNQKNDMVRREADLMYRQKQQALEEQHEELEYELRILMQKPGMYKQLLRRLSSAVLAVLKGCPFSRELVATQNKWPLVAGQFVSSCGLTREWPLKTGNTV